MEAENPNLVFLTEQNKNVFMPSTGNRVCFSELNSIYIPTSSNHYCIMLVLKGKEVYEFGSKKYNVPENFFLTTVPNHPGMGMVDSKNIVEGLCITINFKTISDAYHLLVNKNSADVDESFFEFFKSPDFFENVNPVKGSALGVKLLEFASEIRSNSSDVYINDEWFFELAEDIVNHEYINQKKLQSIPSLKSSTRKEILRRMLVGRQFIEDNFNKKISVYEIAQACMMSEFYFYRSFKKVFRVSPHQYQVKKKIEQARKMICEKDVLLSHVAAECGFPDIHSFSKSFKKELNISPAAFKAAYHN